MLKLKLMRSDDDSSDSSDESSGLAEVGIVSQDTKGSYAGPFPEQSIVPFRTF